MEVSPIAGLQHEVNFFPNEDSTGCVNGGFPDCGIATLLLSCLAARALSCVNGGFPDCGIATRRGDRHSQAIHGSVNGGFPDCGIATALSAGGRSYPVGCEWRFPRLRDCNIAACYWLTSVSRRVNGGFPDCGIATANSPSFYLVTPHPV